MITSRNTGLKPQSGAAFNFIYTVRFGRRKQVVYGEECAQVGSLELYLVSLCLSRRETGKEFMERRQPALCVPGLFVTSPPVCALCKWAGGLGGTAPWETAGANPAC